MGKGGGGGGGELICEQHNKTAGEGEVMEIVQSGSYNH